MRIPGFSPLSGKRMSGSRRLSRRSQGAAAGVETKVSTSNLPHALKRTALAVGTVRRRSRHVLISGKVHTATLLIRFWPEVVSPDFFRDLLHAVFRADNRGDFTVRVTLRYLPARVVWDWRAKAKLRRLEKSVSASRDKPGEMPRPEEERALRSMEYLRERTAYATADVMDLWGFITVTARSRQDLDKALRLVNDRLRKGNVQLAELAWEQLPALGQVHPLGVADGAFYQDHPGRLVDDRAAAALNPFTFGSSSDGRLIYIGHRVADGSATYMDINRDAHQNKNFIILGATGEGKSVFEKELTRSFVDEGIRVIVFDVDGEYRVLCDTLGGLWVDHTLASGRYADPLQLQRPIGVPEFDLQRVATANACLRRTVSLLLGAWTPEEANAVDRALMATWTQVGIDIDRPDTWDNDGAGRRANIHLWYKMLSKDRSKSAGAVREKLWQYFEGSMRNMFARADEDVLTDTTSPLTVFHVAESVNNESDDLTGAVKISLALDSVWREVQVERARGERWTAVGVDEGQRLLLNPIASKDINTMATTIRKWNGLLYLATNKPTVLFGAEATSGGSGLWSNSAFKVLFWMEESDINAVRQHGEVPEVVIDQIRRSHRKFQFVFRYGDYWDHLQMRLPVELLRLYKTRGLKNA